MKTLKAFALAVLALGATQAALAVKIKGDITFAGGVSVNGSSIGLATGVQGFVATVDSVSGDFDATIDVDDLVTFGAPLWLFNSGAINAFWSVGGFTFDLSSSHIVSQDANGVEVSGSGWISGNGYEATEGSWNFSTHNSTSTRTFNFTGFTEAVPDAGTTSILLGLGLVGIAAIRRFKN